MDILDIDEALKDDSFIFLEDKTHDDVSNILQQWKSNNCLQQQQHQLHQQQQPEQAYKLNSRTFTRPKRKSTQNLESQFSNTSQFIPQLRNGSPVLNVEIGGLVTTMQKSFLQDTSPPSSICSSMDISVDRMNNSLITSADFININFLQSTNGLDFNNTFSPDFDLANKVTNDGYTLNDMIRDRKALESLTMSGDGTLIKDCNIAQIDDISLALSKTASGCSTMDNSTESMDANNRTIQLAYNHNVVQQTNIASNDVPGIMHKTIILNNELISDTTFNLIENSMYDSVLNVTRDQQRTDINTVNETFKTPILLDDTISLSGKDNISFDCQDDDTRCETPENISMTSIPSKFYESTPQAANLRKNKQQYTPTIKTCDDVNISPIIPINGVVNANMRILSETFNNSRNKTSGQGNKINSDTFSGVVSNLDAMEMIEDRKKPNETFCSNSFKGIHEQYDAGNAMRDVMDLAEAEAELLAGSSSRFHRKSKQQQYTPTITTCDDVNTAPIILNTTTTCILSETFDSDNNHKMGESNKINSDTFSGVVPNLDSMEMIEDIKNPNETFSSNLNELHQERYDAGNAMRNVMDLAQAEAELLAENDDEEEFEHMLDEFSKVELNAEQLKMKKSLDSIKKRFTYSFTENNDRELSSEAKDMREIMKNSTELIADEIDIREEANITINAKKPTDFVNQSKDMKMNHFKTIHGNVRDLKESMVVDPKESIKELRDSSSNNLTSSTSISTSSSSGGERLLSRRSRLYDDINLSSLSMQSKSPASSFTMQKHEKGLKESEEENEIQKTETTQAEISGEKTEGCVNGEAIENVIMESESEKKSHRLAEKRERDRDRFKTIKIVKQRTTDSDNDGGRILNVPCIDNDDDIMNEPANTTINVTEVPKRMSRRDHISPSSSDPVVINSNTSPELDNENRSTKAKHTNYLTYKKPKEKIAKPNHPDVPLPAEHTKEMTSGAVAKTRLDQRSLSRPRYISGLQKFNVVSKATSAGDLEKTSDGTASKLLNLTANSGHNALKYNVITSNTNRTQPYTGNSNSSSVKELKSPMGIKAKSFHNLSSNFGYSNATTAQKSCSSGARNKTINSGVSTEKQTKNSSMRTNQSINANRTSNASFQQQPQKINESLFKVPKLVSGIRAPSSTGGVKRAGLVRPSSGYYSLNVAATVKNVPTTADFDIDSGRQSPTDSISSTSSRSSAHSVVSGLKPLNTVIIPSTTDSQLPSTLIKVSTGSTGIPKPSGLRPPSNIKRSGLPRPASIVRR